MLSSLCILTAFVKILDLENELISEFNHAQFTLCVLQYFAESLLIVFSIMKFHVPGFDSVPSAVWFHHFVKLSFPTPVSGDNLRLRHYVSVFLLVETMNKQRLQTYFIFKDSSKSHHGIFWICRNSKFSFWRIVWKFCKGFKEVFKKAIKNL